MRYDHIHQGWATIGDKMPIYFRSRWELNIAKILQNWKENGLILEWIHEEKTYYFEDIKRGVTSYLPDFFIYPVEGDMYLIEVKGRMDPKSKTKLTRMAKYYPDIKIDIIRESEYKAYLKEYKNIIDFD